MVDESIYIKKTSLCMLDYDLLPYMVVLILPMKILNRCQNSFKRIILFKNELLIFSYPPYPKTIVLHRKLRTNGCYPSFEVG
jgi:hypothetical protein